MFLATPAWTREVYVLYDLTRLNGTIFSAHISPAVDRASILSVADVDSHLDVQVFVHDLPRPLQQNEIVQVSTGYCISIVPRQHPPFAVASLADMLLSSAGWNAQIVLPLAPDRWLHVLTDTEPCRFRLDSTRRMHLRNDLADMLAYEVEDLTVQPAQPRILDHLDYGVRAQSVVVATQLLAREAEASETRTIFLLDMRPITAGLAWGVANHGRVRADLLVARFDSHCPAGYRSQITGGRPLHTDEGLYFEARPGEVLYVDYVVRDVVSSDTEDDPTPGPSAASPSSDGEGHSSSSDSAASSRRSRPSRLNRASGTGSEATHPQDGTSHSGNREECQTCSSLDAPGFPSTDGSGGRVVMWSDNSFSDFVEIVGWHITSVLPASLRYHSLLACTVVLCSLLILIGQDSRAATLPCGWGSALVAVLIYTRALFAVMLCSFGLPAAEAMHIPPLRRASPAFDMPCFGIEQLCSGAVPCLAGPTVRRPLPTPSRSRASMPILQSEAFRGRLYSSRLCRRLRTRPSLRPGFYLTRLLSILGGSPAHSLAFLRTEEEISLARLLLASSSLGFQSTCQRGNMTSHNASCVLVEPLMMLLRLRAASGNLLRACRTPFVCTQPQLNSLRPVPRFLGTLCCLQMGPTMDRSAHGRLW